MDEVQTAALYGAEVAIRKGIWLGRTHYRSGFHITATAGTFGSVAGYARLMKLTFNQIRMALGLAASPAAGCPLNLELWESQFMPVLLHLQGLRQQS